jgi:hypothetical protein
MPNAVKFLVGLALALAAGAVSHGPMGRGEAFIAELDAQLQAVIADVDLPSVTGAMQREPLARTALLSGPANQFQREGQGSLPGLNQRVLAITGMGRLEWTNPPP